MATSSSFEERIELEYIKPESFLLEHLMMGFRLLEGIKTEHLNNVFRMNIKNYLEPLFDSWRGKLVIGNKSIHLTKEGLSLLNPFLLDIASLIGSNPPGISGKKINWPPDS